MREAQREMLGFSSQSQPEIDDDHAIPPTRQSSPIADSHSDDPVSAGSPPSNQLQTLASRQSAPNSREPSLNPSNEQDDNEAAIQSPSMPTQEKWAQRGPLSGALAGMRKRGNQDLVSTTSEV
jgi:hypothetical protein